MDRALRAETRRAARRAAPALAEAMAYSLLLPGKRFRPALMMAACEACGGRDRDVLPFACAVEMIHTYSLIHDDLPCMDNAELRRGKPASHKVFGEASAVLAGDALLTDAFALASEGPSPVSAARRAAILAEIARAAGSGGMASGQVLDLEAERKRISLKELEALHRKKTGAIIVASCRIGALAAGAGARKLDALTRYGAAVGLAFQVVDDILDVIGDEKALGKQVGGDLLLRKSTFPALLGLERAAALALELRDQALASLKGFGTKAKALGDLASFVVDRRS